MQPDEQSLVNALRQGDRRACSDLVERYSRQVYNVALRLVQQPAEAEDVLQETFINACRGAEQFEGRSSLSTWLYRIATNNGLMRLRRKQTPTVSLNAPPSDEAGEDFEPRQLEDWDWNPETLILTDELRQAMDEAVSALPDSLRGVFVLRDIEGLSTQETAETLDISLVNVKVRLHRARLLLRERLAGYFTGHGSTEELAHVYA